MLMVSSVVFEFWSIWFLHVYFKGHSRLKMIVIQDLFRTMTSPTLSSPLLSWVLSYNSFMLFELLKGQNYAVWASLVARRERICLSCQSCRGLGQISVGLEDLLDEGMATQSSIFVWRIPWTEEPERRVLRVAAGHD